MRGSGSASDNGNWMKLWHGRTDLFLVVVVQFQLLFDLNGNLHRLIYHLQHVDLNSFVQKLDMLLRLECKNQMNL
jgi:hypothetical protein